VEPNESAFHVIARSQSVNYLLAKSQNETRGGGMMDPGTLAMTAVSLLAGYLSRHGNELVDRIGDAAVNRLGSLYSWVRDHLRQEPSAGAALEGLERAPADARRQGSVEFALTQLIERDTALAGQLAELVKAVNDENRAAIKITESGAVAVGGDVRLDGTYVAGRDLTIGRDPGAAEGIPPARDPSPGQR
jgi:hypothetical protein